MRWSLGGPPLAGLDAGDTTSVRLRAEIYEGWYLYSLTQPPGGPIRTTITLAADAPFELAGPVRAPKPDEYPDRNFNIFSEVYEDSVTFALPVRRDDRPESRGDELVVLVRYQTCTDRYCLPPRTDTVGLELPDAGSAHAVPTRYDPPPASPVAAGAGGEGETTRGSQAANVGERETASIDLQQLAGVISGEPTSSLSPPAFPGQSVTFGGATSDSLIRFLLLAVTLGLLSLLTPCVFPLLPITVGFFAKRTGDSQLSNLRAATAYGLGIVVTFSALGLMVAVLFGAGGIVRLAANPWLNLAVAALFVAFALNLLGVWQVTLPATLLSRLSRAGNRASGIPAAVLMGGTFSLTSFTCTAPFVGTLLVLATQGSWRWPLLGLTAYAAAFALPFFLLALVPSWAVRLPRSGPWMVTLKSAIAVLELAAAVKFVSNADLVWHWGVFTREVVIALWISAGLALGAVILLRPRPQQLTRPSWPRALLTTASLGGMLWLAGGLGGARLGELEAFLPPARPGAGEELVWRLNDYEGSLRAAFTERRPVLLDFTGYTCTNCRWMEANMFTRPEVHARLEEFVRVRLYTDGQGSPYEQQQALQQELFGTVALPYYAILTPAGEPIASFLGMTRDANEFARFLQHGLAPVLPPLQAAAPDT